MNVQIETFERKTFRVQAVRVTTTNMKELGDWCGGVFKAPEAPGRRAYVEVPNGRPGNTIRAYVGDWITRLTEANSCRVYKDRSFLEAFRQIVSDSEKQARIQQYIRAAMQVQDVATYHGESSNVGRIVEETAEQIAALF